MKKFIFILGLSILMPLAAHADLPGFPMSFYGAVYINDIVAPVGTIVRAYYGDTFAGEVTVNEEGVYGYAASTAQKLLVASSTGPITFKVISPSFNKGVETAGKNQLSYPGFVQEGSINLTLPFRIDFQGSESSKATSQNGGGGSATVPTVIVPLTANKSLPFTAAEVAKIKAMDVPQLISFLIGYLTAKNVVLATTPVAPTVSTVSTGTVSSGLGVGSASPTVKNVQQYLNTHGYEVASSGPGSQGNESAYFGALTKAAIIRFQKDRGIPATGYFGPLTKNAMFGN